jgi:hypothetical protein
MTPIASQLLERITSRRARVGVGGLGYVGLPLVTEFARSGFVSVGMISMCGRSPPSRRHVGILMCSEPTSPHSSPDD